MKRHLFGAILFCVIVGTTIFVDEYFSVLPILPIIDDSIISCEIFETPNFQVNGIFFNKRNQRFSATIKFKKWEGIQQKAFLHFFTVKNGKAKFLLTQEFSLPMVSTANHFITNQVEIKSLSKPKSLQNIYVTVDSLSDYSPNETPEFNSELAMQVEVF